MADHFTFGFRYDDIEDDAAETFTGTGEDTKSVTIVAGENELLEARLHSIEEMVSRFVFLWLRFSTYAQT